MSSKQIEKTADMVSAEEMMIPLERYPCVTPDTSISEAIQIIENAKLTANRQNSLPRAILVIDVENRLLGVVRRRDIMRGLEPKFLQMHPLDYRKKLFDIKIDPNLSEIAYDHLVQGVKEQAQKPVSDIMLSIKVTMEHDCHLIKVVYEMVTNSLALIPVMKNGIVIGVLRSVDVFRHLSQLVVP